MLGLASRGIQEPEREPELIDGKESICERWNASHVAYEYAAPRPAVISGERGKIPDAFDALGLAVDA